LLEVDESFDGREIELPVGDELEVVLKENPTTGFRWEVESMAKPACALADDNFELGQTARGSGGIHRWRLKAKQKGEGKISLRYRRSWETKAPARTFTVTVRVT
jgi:inhibitor of cysteine peptidase